MCTLLVSESPHRGAALEYHAVNAQGDEGGSLEQSVGLKVKWYVATDCTHCTQ